MKIMVGQMDEKAEIKRALKVYIMKDRERQRLKDEAEAERTRKRKEYDEKKIMEESELKLTKEKLAEITKKQEQLQNDKIKIFEHLKKVVSETNRHILGVDDLSRLYEIGLAVTCASNVTSHAAVHPTGSMSTSLISRSLALPASSQFRTSTTSSLSVQAITHQKRSRSPSPTVYRSTYNYKQAAGPHAFQKLEDSHRNHEYRSYLFKPGNSSQSGSYSAFYSPSQSTAYTLPSSGVHTNASIYSNYGSNRENTDPIHKGQQQNAVSAPPSHSPSQHSSLYASHRSSIQSGTPVSVSSNHISYLAEHSKNSSSYIEDKYYMVKSTAHIPIHSSGVPLQQAPQASKHGSITSGYPVRPVAAQINTQAQLHLSQHGGNHHNSQSLPHSSQTSLHTSAQTHHSPLSSNHSSQPQPHGQQNTGHQTHHQSSSVHYQSSQAHMHHQATQPLQQSPISVSLSQQTHHSGAHHQQHIPELHLQSHHSSQTPSSHHQLIHHATSPSIHHTSAQHMQQIHHHLQQHQLLQQQQSTQPHAQSLHHSQLQQPHIQQHISSNQQQSQTTSVVSSQGHTR